MKNLADKRWLILVALLLGAAGVLSFAAVSASGGSDGASSATDATAAQPTMPPPEGLSEPPALPEPPAATPTELPRPTAQPPEPPPTPQTSLPRPIAPSGCRETTLKDGLQLVGRFDPDQGRVVTEMGTFEIWLDECARELFTRDVVTGTVSELEYVRPD